MEKNRADYPFEESGIALITVMVMTLAILILVGEISYLLVRGFRASVINKEFATVYDAANGGVEHAAGIILSHWSGLPTDALGSYTGELRSVLNCTSTTNELRFTTHTADSKYRIDMNIRCLGKQAIPGAGGTLSFPPPKGLAGGGMAVWYVFYSIISTAEENSSPKRKGRTEAVYRLPA
jgi:hypothetical protein